MSPEDLCDFVFRCFEVGVFLHLQDLHVIYYQYDDDCWTSNDNIGML